MQIRIDKSEFPLVVVTYPERTTDADLDELMRWFAEIAAKRQKFALVIDTSAGTALTSGQRKRMADAMRDDKGALRAAVVACAMVITSAIARGTMTALSWLASPPFPLKSFDCLAPARQWAQSRLADKTTT